MGLAKRIDRHATLFQNMADTVHADLGESLLDGKIDGQGLRAAVFQCMTCDSADECPQWMEAHPDGAENAPEYCRNRQLLQRLKS